jgi:HEAT repeat protein
MVREAAVRALGTLGDSQAIEPLTHSLQDRMASVRALAKASLQKLDPSGQGGESSPSMLR